MIQFVTLQHSRSSTQTHGKRIRHEWIPCCALGRSTLVPAM